MTIFLYFSREIALQPEGMPVKEDKDGGQERNGKPTDNFPWTDSRLRFLLQRRPSIEISDPEREW